MEKKKRRNPLEFAHNQRVNKLMKDSLEEKAIQDANREMLGDDADYFDAAGIDYIGDK